VLRLALLALVLLAPLADAQSTLASLEEPHLATDADVAGRIWAITVLPEEAGEERTLVFRNPVRSPFRLDVYDERGEVVFNQSGTRGIQRLPALAAGDYRFRVDRAADFQVTEKVFSRVAPENVTAQLAGTDAYVLIPNGDHRVRVEGAVEVEWWEMTGASETLAAPFSRDAPHARPHVLTIRGEEGAAYSIGVEQITLPPEVEAEETPLAVWAPLAALAAVALARRGRGIHK